MNRMVSGRWFPLPGGKATITNRDTSRLSYTQISLTVMAGKVATEMFSGHFVPSPWIADRMGERDMLNLFKRQLSIPLRRIGPPGGELTQSLFENLASCGKVGRALATERSSSQSRSTTGSSSDPEASRAAASKLPN